MTPPAASNGAPVRELGPAETRELLGKPRTNVFDVDDRLYPSFDDGRVFDIQTAEVRDLKQMLRQDGQARKVEQVLTQPIRAAAWAIHPHKDDKGEAEWVRAQLDDRMSKLIDQMTTAVSFRKAFFELTFRLDGDQLAVADIGFRPAATCEQGHDAFTGEPSGFRQNVAWTTGMLTRARGSGQNAAGIIRASLEGPQRPDASAPGYVDVPEGRSFVYVHGSYREPISGTSDLDVAWWCYTTVKKLQFLWFQYLEQQSLPKVAAYGDDPIQAGRNADAIAQAKASGVVGLERSGEPGDRPFDVIESSGKGADQFLQAIGYVEGKMSASVLAGFTDLASVAGGSTTGPGGSYALSADQSEFFLAARQAAADEIADAISKGLIAKLVALQFGPDAHPPTVEIGPLSKRDKDRALVLLNALLTADHFNAPPVLVDMLINAVAGYVGLPPDQVAQAVKDHPTQDPQVLAAQVAQVKAGPGAGGDPNAEAPAGPDGGGEPTPVGQGEQSVADDPMAAVRRLAGLAHQLDTFVARVDDGEDPRAVLATLGMAA